MDLPSLSDDSCLCVPFAACNGSTKYKTNYFDLMNLTKITKSGGEVSVSDKINPIYHLEVQPKHISTVSCLRVADDDTNFQRISAPQ